jgi:hypothetical protein
MKPSGSKQAASHRRWWIWLPLLGVGGWLALFGDKSPASDAAVSLPVRGPTPTAEVAAAPTAAPAPAAALDSLQPLVPRDRLAAVATADNAAAPATPRDLFSARNWNPPPPPAPVAPPAAPVAPPLPYVFIGKKHEGDAWEVYLTKGEQTFVVRQGEVLEATYRVDKIQPPTLTLTYLPLDQAQTLPIGDSR